MIIVKPTGNNLKDRENHYFTTDAWKYDET